MTSYALDVKTMLVLLMSLSILVACKSGVGNTSANEKTEVQSQECQTDTALPEGEWKGGGITQYADGRKTEIQSSVTIKDNILTNYFFTDGFSGISIDKLKYTAPAFPKMKRIYRSGYLLMGIGLILVLGSAIAS
jgi:hypothetical protein